MDGWTRRMGNVAPRFLCNRKVKRRIEAAGSETSGEQVCVSTRSQVQQHVEESEYVEPWQVSYRSLRRSWLIAIDVDGPEFQVFFSIDLWTGTTVDGRTVLVALLFLVLDEVTNGPWPKPIFPLGWIVPFETPSFVIPFLRLEDRKNFNRSRSKESHFETKLKLSLNFFIQDSQSVVNVPRRDRDSLFIKNKKRENEENCAKNLGIFIFV